MAEVLEDYEFSNSGSPKYPWDQWLDGRIWKLRYGVDFHVEPETMQAGAANYARRHRMRIQTSIPDENTLILRRKDEDE